MTMVRLPQLQLTQLQLTQLRLTQLRLTLTQLQLTQPQLTQLTLEEGQGKTQYSIEEGLSHSSPRAVPRLSELSA